MNKENSVNRTPLVSLPENDVQVVDSVAVETERILQASREHIQQMHDSFVQNEAFITHSRRRLFDGKDPGDK